MSYYSNSIQVYGYADGKAFENLNCRTESALMDFHLSDGQENWVTHTFESRHRSRTYTWYIDPRYERTNRKTFNTQRECADAWEEMKFPTHNVNADGTAELYSSGNYRAEQFKDGTGRIRHYSITAAIRTRTGAVISNSQDWATGFSKVTHPNDSDGSAPLTGISALLSESDVDADMYDIESVHTGTRLSLGRYSGMYEGDTSEKVVVFNPDDMDRFGVMITRDSTSKESVQCGFVLSNEELRALDSVQDGLDLLIPDEVRYDGRQVVGTHQMSPHHSNSYYDQRGEVIQRQGEWFFIPVPEFDTDGPVYKPRNGTWDNLPHTDVQTLPRECSECGATDFYVDNTVTQCNECGQTYRNQDQIVKTYNGLDEPAGADRLGSHKATRVVADGGHNPLYVNGTVRHERNEHPMARLGDTWHLAVRHDRDVMVFEDKPGYDSRSGRRRGGRRWD